MKSQYSSRDEGMKVNRLAIVAAFLAAVAASPAGAQLPIPASTQFDLVGFIQEATLGAGTSGLNVGPGLGAHQGGIIKVNGHVIIIPSETIVILPASAYTWQELFALAPLPYGPTQTGMALADLPTPLTTYEAHVTGNRVLGGSGGPDVYIAGLVHIAQQDLNSGAGYINFMDYATGEMRVGGTLNSSTTGARVRISDPVGRFGRAMAADARFAVDDANPTIASATGFPMCFPRVAPSGVVGGPETDPLCPQANRPGPSIINMAPPAAGVFPNPNFQVPLQVGDYVSFAGTLVTDRAQPTVGPPPTAAEIAAGVGTYVSAHTISSNIAVYTAPGTNPAYVSIEVGLIGTGGLTVIGGGEAVIRTKFEGMSTDPSRNIHLYGVDLDPLTGATTDRDWGTVAVDPGTPIGPVKGRWRFRPPCSATPATVSVTSCSPPPLGVFIPPTREVRAVIEGMQSQNPANPAALTSANGIFYGQYHAPIGEYIFPENIPGTPIVENNFNTIPFLAQGGYSSSTSVVVGQLNPWPSNVVPTSACQAPVANAGGPYSVAFGGSVALNGSATGTQVSLAWTVTSGGGTLTNPTIGGATYSSVGGTSPVTLTLTATSGCGAAPSTSTATVNINAAATPTVNHIAGITVLSGFATRVTLPISGIDPGGLPLTFAVTQTGAPALLLPAVASTGAASASYTFGVPTLPVGQVVPAVITLSITATNSGGATSAAEITTVTIKPVPDSVTITNVTYRISKQRLVITATSSVVSPNLQLTLRPYVTNNGLTFDPTALGNTFTNNGGGLYTLTLVGAPQPAVAATPTSLIVQSNQGGVSAAHGIDNLRQ